MSEAVELELEELIGEKELDAFKSYIKLTEYQNIIFSEQSLVAANRDYATRDMTFPIDLLIEE